MSEIATWYTFYLIVGAASGTLIGLQFVVMTLVSARPNVRAAQTGAAGATSPIVHYSVTLLLSPIVLAPWHTIPILATLWGIISVSGGAYEVPFARRMRVQAAFMPVFESWLFHVLLPLAAYGTLGLAAVAAPSVTRPALFGVGAATLVLLFSGIHNTWVSVSYHALLEKEERDCTRR